mmetsp:Transcript_10282/g.25725  ORF Transcript_10282/g.25725 Transcript_10282/m.25725 type:complete len:206 (+) Transcript_10282:681-1298(+)
MDVEVLNNHPAQPHGGPIARRPVHVQGGVGQADEGAGQRRNRRIEHIQAAEAEVRKILHAFRQLHHDCTAQGVARAERLVSREELSARPVVVHCCRGTARWPVAENDHDVVAPIPRERQRIDVPVGAPRRCEESAGHMICQADKIQVGVEDLKPGQGVLVLRVLLGQCVEPILDPLLAGAIVHLRWLRPLSAALDEQTVTGHAAP